MRGEPSLRGRGGGRSWASRTAEPPVPKRSRGMFPGVAPVDRPLDPRSAPAYTVAEAAALVRVPISTLKTWIHGEGASKKGLLVLPPSRPRLLAFSHLVEAFVLAAIRRGHGVALQRVRKAIQYVQRELHVERPLIHAKFKTDGVDLFVDQWGRLVNASKDGQVAIARCARVKPQAGRLGPQWPRGPHLPARATRHRPAAEEHRY